MSWYTSNSQEIVHISLTYSTAVVESTQTPRFSKSLAMGQRWSLSHRSRSRAFKPLDIAYTKCKRVISYLRRPSRLRQAANRERRRLTKEFKVSEALEHAELQIPHGGVLQGLKFAVPRI